MKTSPHSQIGLILGAALFLLGAHGAFAAPGGHGGRPHPAHPAGGGHPGDGGDRQRPDRPDRDPGVNARQENQQDRIAQGVKSGQLTKDEAKGLEKTEKDIRQEERQDKSDGVMTKDERKDLHQDLNAASKSIYQEKHDAETRPGVTPAPATSSGVKDPGVNARQENQQDRIAQGVKSGQLTPHEAQVLQNKEQRLSRMEQRLKADGTLSPEDRARMQSRLNALSADIARQKHDAQTVPTTTP